MNHEWGDLDEPINGEEEHLCDGHRAKPEVTPNKDIDNLFHKKVSRLRKRPFMYMDPSDLDSGLWLTVVNGRAGCRLCVACKKETAWARCEIDNVSRLVPTSFRRHATTHSHKLDECKPWL